MVKQADLILAMHWWRRTPSPPYDSAMTSPGPDAFSSRARQPVPPQPPQPYPAPWASPAGPQPYGQPPYGQPYPSSYPPPPPFAPVSPRPAAPTHAKKGGRRWIIATAAVLVVVLGGVIALGLLVSGSTKVIADGQHRVSIRVPRTWVNYTEPYPDQVLTPAEEEDLDEVPDLDAGSPFGGSDLSVYLDPAAPGGLTQAHQIAVADECEQRTCLERGTSRPVIIDGRRGLEQVVTHFDHDEGASVTVLLTTQREDLVVSATASGYTMRDDPPSPDRLIASCTPSPSPAEADSPTSR